MEPCIQAPPSPPFAVPALPRPRPFPGPPPPPPPPAPPEEVGGGQLPQLGLAIQGVYCLKHVAVQPPPVQVVRQGVQIVGAAAQFVGKGEGDRS